MGLDDLASEFRGSGFSVWCSRFTDILVAASFQEKPMVAAALRRKVLTLLGGTVLTVSVYIEFLDITPHDRISWTTQREIK